MPSSPGRGIFCLEGQWAEHLDDRSSVLPTLEHLERLQVATYIHRDVATREELDFYLTKWPQRRYGNYRVLYLAFHGDRGAINIGRDWVALRDLADCIGDRAAGRIIYFGACSVLADTKGVADFRAATKAKVVCGYRRSVDWVVSSAFDLILLERLVSSARTDTSVRSLHRRYPDLTGTLGFVSDPAFDIQPA